MVVFLHLLLHYHCYHHHHHLLLLLLRLLLLLLLQADSTACNPWTLSPTICCDKTMDKETYSHQLVFAIVFGMNFLWP